MKAFTRMANAITETPTRPGKDKPSERQQGDSKRTKPAGGDTNYYDAFNSIFNTKEKEEGEEEAGDIEEEREVSLGGKVAGSGKNLSQLKSWR
jgi:hypothetical protein